MDDEHVLRPCGPDSQAAPGHPSDLPSRLLASRLRSEEYGVPPDVAQPAFAGTVADDSLFLRCGEEVLVDLARTLGAEPVSLMLTDADGRVLSRFCCDDALSKSMDAAYLAPGFCLTEREAGTNGVGLALADRTPSIVRAEEHYASNLRSFTCAAVPVLDLTSGRVQGCINVTTWSGSPHDLLLALAQAAAHATGALLLARSTGRQPRAVPRGGVFRVETPRLEPGSGSLHELSHSWTAARSSARDALRAGRVVLGLGEAGSGRATMLAQAARLVAPSSRILLASPPRAEDVLAWLELWGPEVAKAHTAMVIRDVDTLPLWAAERLAALLSVAATAGPDGDSAATGPIGLTAEEYDAVPAPLRVLVGAITTVPPLRERSEDVLVLAHHVARRVRGHDVELSTAAQHALTAYPWPGNVAQLTAVVRRAVEHADRVDLPDLPPALLSTSTRHLSRIETFERDEIVRVLTQDEVSMQAAAVQLGLSRATLYRKLAYYDIHLSRQG